MPKNLVIVESPAKAKTIEGYLGADFIVKSSYGHVRDLPDNATGIDVENNYKPTYVISDDKKQIVSELKKLAKESEIIWLATDDDREGEAISWHLYEALDLNDKNTRRIVFREITKNAILNAIQTPRGIDIDLVNAQQARRVLDRLVGYELSPVLWKKIKRGLSAGRVQSVAVRFIVDREREIEKFNSSSYFKVVAIFDLEKGKKLKADLPQKFATEQEALDFLEKCKGAAYTIKNLEKKPAKKSPSPPFTTSTLQQEAGRKLYFSVAQTMTVAQRLYEAGKISYMRTDSVNLSEDAIASAKSAITKDYGPEYFKQRKYSNKQELAQEAHEAIRPTDFSVEQGSSDRNEQRLYDLIRKRAKASQMADAEIERTTATITISGTQYNLTATGEVIKFEGFLKAYQESTDEDEVEGEDEEENGALPPLNVGQILQMKEINARQTYNRPAPRYTESSLVKTLEEAGIGRPSTYAPTISTIQNRGYVIKENRDGKTRDFVTLTLAKDQITNKKQQENYGAEKSKLFPTDTAMVVNDFLVTYFPNIVDFSFTANVEKEFDDIARGKKEWGGMIDSFYKGFHDKVTDTTNIDRKEVSNGRELGIDPVSGKMVSVRLGKFGAFAQLGEAEEDKKPAYASLKKGQLMESISLADAMELFKLPREAGIFEEKPMTVAIGKFGPYVKHDSKFYSLDKLDDPMTVSEERAIAIIENKRKAESEKLIKDFPENAEVKVLNGRYGPYIAVGKKNVKIPKGKEPKDVTLEECLVWADETPDKKPKFVARGKKK
ncbi:MAG: type I DNA topoisomerase [Opitutaceae bacterium]|nr:type I DNA topoisomerase [Cytophagales bacterium]